MHSLNAVRQTSHLPLDGISQKSILSPGVPLLAAVYSSLPLPVEDTHKADVRLRRSFYPSYLLRSFLSASICAWAPAPPPPFPRDLKSGNGCSLCSFIRVAAQQKTKDFIRANRALETNSAMSLQRHDEQSADSQWPPLLGTSHHSGRPRGGSTQRAP